ncbi:MAG TPA: UDP-N-acetylmuramate dehydrogenase [Candidatus Paceibacterota bacterium]|nr:UDP-N-acetylmuramate dehydrogenase [Candidatus Paceibacterota bacterium]
MALKIQENIPLAPLTTFTIGGNAKYFLEANSTADIQEAIQWAKEEHVRFVVLAGGSNVLVPDEGIDGLVIHIVSQRYSFESRPLSEEIELIAEAGCNLLALIREASSKGLGGWEKLAGIPGSIGGAIRGNAGAFGSEIKDFIRSVYALNVETKETKEFTNADCNFSYRHSFFKEHPEWIILSVQVRLAQSQYEDIQKSINDTITEREKRHLQNVRAAGSYFMNPVAPREIVEMFEKEKGIKSREGRVPAGWLIEKAGMKGAKVGGAIASLQHPNYIVNTGNATAADVLELAQKIRRVVKEKFDVQLQEEAVRI